MIQAELQTDPAAISQATGQITEALRPDLPGPFHDALIRALDELMAWEQQRYDTFAFGGGDWPDLAPSTKLKRAYKSGWRRGRHRRGEQTALDLAAQMHFPILQDTLTLYSSLRYGNEYSELQFDAETAAQVTVDPKGRYGQFGGSVPGRPPQRQFVVPPPAEVIVAVTPGIVAGATASINEKTVSLNA